MVATRLLGSGAGLVSGSALLVDYVLTISVSIAAGGDAIWSFLPPHLAAWKVPAEGAAIVLLVVMNLRGVKESVSVLAPIFGIFLVTHAILIFGGVGSHLGEAPAIATELVQQGRTALGTMGWTAIAGVFIYAYSMGAGTYTGIEAVSNGLQIMREPRVATAKRTMVYMAVSLSVTAGPVGRWFVAGTLVISAALLFVAAQAGFLDGPRVMANMAIDNTEIYGVMVKALGDAKESSQRPAGPRGTPDGCPAVAFALHLRWWSGRWASSLPPQRASSPPSSSSWNEFTSSATWERSWESTSRRAAGSFTGKKSS